MHQSLLKLALFVVPVLLAATRLTIGSGTHARAAEGTLTPPATPLVACDPYFSIWSPAPRLYDADTTHWTGKPHRLTSLVRIDDKSFRVMGAQPAEIAPLPQTSLQVLPTRTQYKFAGAGIELTLTFTTAALPDDVDLLSRPVTYLTYQGQATDGKTHDVQVYFEAAAELAVNTPDQQVTWATQQIDNLTALRIGSRDQAVLGRKGDDLRIDWGYLYVAAPRESGDPTSVARSAIAPSPSLRTRFIDGNSLETNTPGGASAPAGDRAAALSLRLGAVGAQPVSKWLMIAYDDLYSIRFMGSDLRPYWRRDGWEAADLLQAAAQEYSQLAQRCARFDQELMADLETAGGANYAQLAALAYRQCFAAGKFVADANGQPLQFCKENHSNGCIGTSDVFYPMAPQFLLFGPTLAKSFVVPFMEYAASDRWRFPFAPHDLGTYPHANGQVYGGGERTEENQMPVEESGNLLILMAAIAQIEGNADFAGLYWKQLAQWAAYLKDKGFDPENQLCTDDFSGHLAHNVNLSVKAICGLGAFAKLCALRGDQAMADEYSQLAKQFAQRWQTEANDGDHYRLAFDKQGTWSQKYNLVWDQILDLDLFPAEVARKEMDYYLKMQNEYGLPLDNRSTYTKLDWVLWTATLTGQRGDFEALVDPVVRFLNQTPDHSPMTDWYHTHNARKVGFTARPVVGGVFCRLLYEPETWKKWAGRDRTQASGYAPMPKPPRIDVVLPAADDEPAPWSYTTERPADNWAAPDFDAGHWQTGRSGFGTALTPGATVGTRWSSADIWLRREFDLESKLLDASERDKLALYLHHDEDAEIYINGVLAARASGYVTGYEPTPMTPQALATLRPTGNTIAVHCHQTGGGQYIDVGLVRVSK